MYTLYADYVLRDSDGLQIPLSEENSDYQDYLAWCAEGNAPSSPLMPNHAQLVEMAKVFIRIERQPIIDLLDGLQASALTLGDAPRANVIEVAKKGLRDMTQLDLSACNTFEEMRNAVKAAYFALAAALPVDVRKAFSDALK